MNRYSKIPIPVRTADSTGNVRSSREYVKLPNIHKYPNDKHLKKNKSYSRLNNLSDFEYDTMPQKSKDNRPGSMNYPPTTNSLNDASMKRYHSTGHVYPRDIQNNEQINKLDFLDKSSIVWPMMKEDKFTEGYLKMQSLMNAKKEDYLKRKGQMSRFIRNPLPQLPKTPHSTNTSTYYTSNSDEYDSSSDCSNFDTRRITETTDDLESLTSRKKGSNQILMTNREQDYTDYDGDGEGVMYRRRYKQKY